MFFNADDDEQDFLSSSGGSKLASLFGVDKASNQGGNESLKYTAPKQPKKKEAPNQPGGSQAAVTFATAVHAYKYVDGQYASQGKLGAAILGSPASQDYRVLLYVSKQQQVTNVRITPAFVFTIQANNYASFYDDARQSWSLMFDSEENSEKFAKQVGLARANSTGTSLDSVVTQDLHLGDGGPLETGDLVEVKYTGWLLTNGTFGQEFDSNVKTEKQFKFKIGKGKVIKGWDMGVLGMKKGSKRLLVVPPALGYGSQGAGNKIPPNSTLIFEVSAVRVKLAKGESPKPSPAPTPEPVPTHNSTPSPAPSDPELDDSTVKGRTKSITEQMSHQGGSKSDKANLISRMAKMGKPMLPLQGAVAVEPDSDEEEPVPESPKPVAVTAAPVTVQAPHHAATKPPVVAKPVAQQPVAAQMDYTQTATAPVTTNPMMHQPAFMPPPGHQMALYQSPQSLLQQQQAAFLQQQQLLQQQASFQPPVSSAFPPGVYPGAPPFPAAAPVNQSDAATPMLLSETRQQNTELRLAVGKMADKVDTIMQKMDHLQTQQSGALALQSSAPNMEASVLMHNVQRIVQENERLRKEGYEMNSRIEAQNNKISELLQSNQMFVEKSQTLLEQRNEGFKTTATTSQAKVLSLEQEKVQLATQLNVATSQLGTLQLEIAGMRKKEMELQQKLGSSSNDYKKNTEELDSLQAQHTEDEERIQKLSSNLREEKQRRKESDNKLSHLTEELADLRVTAESLEKNLGDRKKNAAGERRKMEEEMEESKLQFEQEIQTLREKLRRQKTSTDAAKAEQVSKLEEEIGEEWKAKSEKQLAAAQDRHARVLQGVKEEKEELEQKVTELESKIQSLRTSSGGSEERIMNLQDQLDDMTGWKNKYDSLRDQAGAMRDKYEARISEVEEERDGLASQRDGLASQRDQLSEQVATLRKQGASPAPSGGSSNVSVITEVKKIMNSVYQQLRGQFTAEGNYSGADILAAILEAIKSTTLKLVQQQSQGPSAEEEEEEEEDDEEELEDSEEEEEEEEEEAEDKASPHPTTETAEPPAEKETAATVQSAEKQDPSEESEESDDFDEEEGETLPDLPEVPKVADDNKSLPIEDPTVEPQPQKTEESSQSVDNSGLEAMESKQGEDNSDKQQDSEPVKQGVDNSNEQQDSEPVIEQSVTENKPETNHIGPEIPKSEPVKRESESSEIIPATSRTPPPLLDDEEEEEEEKEEDAGNKPLFGEDDTVEDTLGISFKPNTDKDKDKKLPTKKDLENDEDLKPQPPPPLFGDDDDDDDLDWLS
ncbi:FK506-binding protein 15-like [Mizuhopecten yessoensis]|uniref:peptidylprolyl isomerase n=1 Tax=Mizuhopecten yessoensis TaxID=6573 RepID=A0A210Q4V0_MIZYE|nr:FK506-binding protein 15-like [Mizuhopecten yessoensis]OWF43709.1 FK506-binding protein 15 [Mizuhopecten yessoensis]